MKNFQVEESNPETGAPATGANPAIEDHKRKNGRGKEQT